jgi:translation initiation factor 2B subunit (eIF-2B alpha/beta/delta family)
VEGSHAVARQTAELLRSVVSQHRMGSSANQAATLADVVRAVGEQLIAANPIGKCFSIFFIVVSCYPVGVCSLCAFLSIPR